MSSPALVFNTPITLEADSRIINVDMKALEKISSGEAVAIILYEIGHAMNPFQNGIEGEFIADDYAIERGYKETIQDKFEKDCMKKRVERMIPDQAE